MDLVFYRLETLWKRISECTDLFLFISSCLHACGFVIIFVYVKHVFYSPFLFNSLSENRRLIYLICVISFVWFAFLFELLYTIFRLLFVIFVCFVERRASLFACLIISESLGNVGRYYLRWRVCVFIIILGNMIILCISQYYILSETVDLWPGLKVKECDDFF